MDTKSLRHHKRSKKNKSFGNGGNTDVLVVPPDILKKLGISIGNTDITHQIHNNFNTLPSAETIYNDYTTNDQTKVNNNTQSSETSILETANLMKKSVFLSPTFIPTVANVIPGEIEITSIKYPMVVQNASMENIEVENIYNEAITGHETYQTDNQININGHLKINGDQTTIPEVNLDPSKFTDSHRAMLHNVDNNTEAQPSCLIKLSTETCNKINPVLTQMECDVTINGLNTSEFSRTLIENRAIEMEGDERNPSEISDSQIKQAERDLISLEGSLIQMDTTEDENTLISLKETDIQIEQAASENNIIHREKPVNIITLGESSNYRNPEKVKNCLTSFNGIPTHKEVEAENNIISIEGNTIQIEAGNVISIERNGALENEIGVENLISLQDIPIQIDPTEVENDLISLEGSIIQLEQAENIIYLDENAVVQCQAHDENAVVQSQAQDENRIVPLETESVSSVHNQNICSLEEKGSQNEKSKNNILLEDNLVQKICEDYLNNILAKDGKFELRDDNNINYNLSEDKVIASLPIVNGDFSELVENEVLVQADEAALEQPVVNSIPLKSTNNTKEKVNKIAAQIKIISEEILSTHNVPDCKRSQSPVIRSLTPVPLNAIVGPASVKRNNNKQNISEVNLTNSNELCNGTENCYSDTIVDETKIKEKNGSNESEVVSICDPEGLKKSDVCVQQPKCEERVHDNNLIVGDLKNKCDNFRQIDMNSYSTTDSSENTVHENEDKSHRDYIEKNKVNIIRHTYLTLTQGSSMPNNHCEKHQNTKECDKDVFDKSSADYKDTSKDNYKLNSELESDKQQTDSENFKVQKKVKIKKKLIMDERKSISDKNINDTDNTANPNEQIDKILKSSIENTDANSHIDKVKEIAECIKKYAQMYKDKKKVNKNDAKMPTTNKKEEINSKSNKIKSKLCIQGVEKPGGIKNKEAFDKVKFLKTYSRERKQRQQPHSILDRNESISTVDTTDLELNSIDIPTSYKQRNFCLCYDFGRLDICDNSYEHIHFWHHNNNSDLESILSIYNDDIFKHQDRTELDDEKLTEVIQDETDIGYICFNYYLNDDDDKDTETSYRMHFSIDKTEATNSADSCKPMEEEIAITIKNNDREEPVQADANNTCIDIEHSAKLGEPESNIVNNSNTSINIKTESKDEDNDSLKIITIIQMEDDDKDVHTTDPYEATGDDLKDTEEKTIVDNNMNTDENNQVASTSNLMKRLDVKETNPHSLDNNQENSRKRKLPASQSEDATNIESREPSSKRTIKCGICDQLLSETEWDLHGTNVHFDVIWKADSYFNCEDPVIINRLKKRLRTLGFLQCPVCNFETKSFYKFFLHLETCIKDYTTSRATTSIVSIICGVCKQNVNNISWIEHIGKEHNYLAWMDGTDTLNLDDEEEVSKHLQNISKLNGGLICYKCGLKRKRANIYLAHLESCDGTGDCFNDTAMSTDLNSTTRDSTDNGSAPEKKIVKCGVCAQDMPVLVWTEHIGREHNYLAWADGTPPLNMDDEEEVWKHLQQFIRHSDGLKCYKCGLNRKRVKLFLSHIKTCDGVGVGENEISVEDGSMEQESSEEKNLECAVCHAKVPVMEWNEHIGRNHNYLAWKVGSPSLNLDDEEEVSKHLQNISKLNGGLICYKCGLKRKRANIYLAHLESCDGTGDCFNDTAMSTDLNSTTRDSTDNESAPEKKIVKCGVCAQDIPVLVWTEHIGREHNYLAWADGTPPLNMDDEEEVWKHLQQFIRHSDGLKCYKCGLNRKRVKLFLSHIKTCDGVGVGENEISVEDGSMEQESSEEKNLECAVCHAKVPVMEWNEHIGRNHNYLAWKVGSPPLDVNDQDAVKEHLLDIIRNYEGLICYKCGLNRRRVKLYLSHIETCDGSKSLWDESSSSFMLESSLNTSLKMDSIQCGVCDQELLMVNWIEHIQKEHGYMAWLKYKEPLDIKNKDMVKAHLLKISKENNGLTCNKCGVTMKYPKCFLLHVQDCTGPSANDLKLKELFVSSFDISDVGTETVMCGVCSNEINKSEWLKHLDEEHDYCAWVVGKPPLDFEDPAVLQKHLTEVSKVVGGLKCKKCGLNRKYAKAYLQHIKFCGQGEDALNLSVAMSGTDPVECAVCSKTIDPKDWQNHAMEEHYNVAWIVGTTPIEINNPYGVEPYIKKYQRKHNNKLVCKRCGVSRISAVGFYAHIITCGKTEEEMEIYKNLCDICNCKYLCIYKSQHMTMHREAEYAQQRKLLLVKEKELKNEVEEPVVGGRRKAADKAKTVIEKYTSNRDEEGTHCSKCGFTSETESEMKDHVCLEDVFQESDSDASVHLSDCLDEDDDDNISDLDSNISNEELEAQYDKETKAKKHGEHGGAHKIQRLPYQIRNVNNYMRKSAEQFVNLHLTNDDLFPQWRCLDYEVVPKTEINNYMPPLEESCKIKYSDKGEWTSYKRFDAIKENDIITMFSGACIQSICWIPSIVGESESKYEHYISVVTHLDSDIPRHVWHEKPSPKPALIQIWDCGNLLAGVPKFAMGVALDCGVIWAMDWCPSGARDVLNAVEKPNEAHRLGLFAVACSTGSAYVFAMPHPSPIKEKGHKFCKLKPVVEMRLATNANRKVYQATAIRWSSQKGHAHIVVGYSDGTVAYYDLLNESPLLRSTENNVTILYPYYDERAQSMCIEDLDMFPRMSEAGGVASGSVAGASLRAAPPAPSAAPPAHVAATHVRFTPHWPAALLAGDDNLGSQAVNEVDWYGAGRRVGGMRACCSCLWCGRVASAAAPLVRLMRTYPAYPELHRQVVATVKMIPFGNKRKRKNDELSMIIEPLTYNEAVLKYGIEFQRITAKDKRAQQRLSDLPRETFPERFPLSDVTGMMFCPSSRNHHKLTVATHSGLIFIINV